MDNKQEKLLKIGNAVFGLFRGSENCPLEELNTECEDCKLSSVCDLVIDLENELSQKRTDKMEIDKTINKLNMVAGMLTVDAMRNPVIRQALDKVIEAGIELDDLAMELEDQEFNQQYHQWVKCSERLPELKYDTSGIGRAEVIVLCKNEHVTAARYQHFSKARSEKGRIPRWDEFSRDARLKYEVIAWMPLPPSPKGE